MTNVIYIHENIITIFSYDACTLTWMDFESQDSSTSHHGNLSKLQTRFRGAWNDDAIEIHLIPTSFKRKVGRTPNGCPAKAEERVCAGYCSAPAFDVLAIPMEKAIEPRSQTCSPKYRLDPGIIELAWTPNYRLICPVAAR